MSIYGNPVMLGGSGGGSTNVLSGTTAPTAAQGSNGAVYLKYGGKVLLQPLVSSQSELTVAVTASTSWSGFEPWKAFTSTTGWIGAGGDPHWLQVEFPSAVELEELDFQSLDGNRSHAISRIGYSDDGATFTDLVLAASTMVSNVGHADISNPVSAKYYRLYFDGSYGISFYPMVSSLEMYTIGGTLVQGTYAKVSDEWQDLIGTDINDINLGGGGDDSTNVLSGTTAPTAAQGSNGSMYLKYGNTKVLLQPLVASENELNVTVTANSYWHGFDPWKAFTSNTAWIGNGGNPHWLQIEFPDFTELSELDFSSVDSNRSHAISRIGCSNDGTNFTDLVLAESTMIGNVGHAAISNPVSSKYYRLYFDGSYDISYYPCISSLLMYASRSRVINSGYAKVNGVWQNIIGTYINDIDLGASDGGDVDCYNQHLFSDMPYTAWVENSSQCSVVVDNVAKKVVFGYTSGDYIGQRFGWQGIYCPGSVTSLHYKITTGSSSYDQSTRFAPGVGILPYTHLVNAVINHNEYGAVTNVGSFLKYAYTTQRNTIVEGTFDLTDVTTPFVLIVFGAGWNAEFSEIIFT